MKDPMTEWEDAINKWEGGFQAMPNDSGNWVGDVLVGTMRGVTPKVLAHHRGVDPTTITRETMMGVTLEEAAQIYDRFYYRAPGLDQLLWSPAVAVTADIGWGSGPVVGVRGLQLLSGAQADGSVGPQTATTFAAWLKRIGHAAAVEAIESWRKNFYKGLIVKRPANQQFLQGWLNRANWYSAVPPTAWWQSWQPLPEIAEPPIPTETVEVGPTTPLPPWDFSRGWLYETCAHLDFEEIVQIEHDALDATIGHVPALRAAFEAGFAIAKWFV